MSWFAKYARSSIGAKQMMAVTGLLMLLFVIAHMLGHLQMFGGQEMYNKYADFLQSMWEIKWPVRIGLVVVLAIHVASGIALTTANKAARPVAYAMYKPVASSPASRTMMLTGLVIFAFIVFHIVHFTLGQVYPEYYHLTDPAGRHDAYTMYVHAFHIPWVFAAYLIPIILLAVHLGHGAASWLQSLGWRHPKYPYDKLGRLIGIVLFLGYMVPPTAVLAGVIKLPGL